MHTGNFPSESHPVLETRQMGLLRVRFHDLKFSCELSPSSRPGQNQHSQFLVCKVKDVPSLLFSLPWIFTSFQKLWWHQHLVVITWLSSPIDDSQDLWGPPLCNVVPGQEKHEVWPGHHTGSISCIEKMWVKKPEYLRVHWCKRDYFPLFPPRLLPLLTSLFKPTDCVRPPRGWYHHLHHIRRFKTVLPLFNSTDPTELMWPRTFLHLSLAHSQSKIYCTIFFSPTCFTLDKYECWKAHVLEPNATWVTPTRCSPTPARDSIGSSVSTCPREHLH